MKRMIQITLVATLFLLSASFIFAADAEVRVSIDGVQVEFTQDSGSPFIDENNRIQVPLRQTLEAFGATVEWDSEARTVIAEKDGITVSVPIDTNSVHKDHMVIFNVTTPVIVDGRTFLPIQAVLNAFGADVFWDEANRAIMVVSDGETITVGAVRISTAITELQLNGADLWLWDEDIVSLRYMINLERFILMHTHVSDLSPLSGLANLKHLELRNNWIDDLSPLSDLTNLTKLDLTGNKISDLSPLSGLANLTELTLGFNEIRDLSPLSGLTELTMLQVWENQVDDLSPLSGLTNLTKLFLGFNEISDLSPLAGLVDLTELNLNRNQITDIMLLSEFENLETLDVSENQISDISPLSRLRNLQVLGLRDNQIDDLSPLSELIHLTILSLNANEIHDLLPLAELTNIEELYLRDNQISDLSPLSGLTSLKHLDLWDNPIDDWSHVEHVNTVRGKPHGILAFNVEWQTPNEEIRRDVKDSITRSHRIFWDIRVTWNNNGTEMRLGMPSDDYDYAWIVENLQREVLLEFRQQDGSVVLTQHDIQNVSIQCDSDSDGYAIWIEFTEKGSEIFSNVTRELSKRPVGENQLQIVFEGDIISSPAVTAPIESGSALIEFAALRDAEFVKQMFISSFRPTFTRIVDDAESQ